MRDGSHGTPQDVARGSDRRRWSPYGRGRWPFAVVDVLIVFLIGLCVLGETGLGRVEALSFYPSKPTWGLGQDWLLVTYDEGRGARAEQHGLGPLAATGRPRIDTIMLLHLPSNDRRPTLIDLPPESYADIAGHGPGSLRAAFAWGGPALLVRAVESVTHVGVERYLQIGLPGLAALVDLVRGVSVCPEPTRTGRRPEPPAPCATLFSGQALAYLRGTTSDHGVIDHAERQRRLVAALIHKAATPGVALNPMRSVALAMHGSRTVTLDRGAHLYDLVRLALTLRNEGAVEMTTIPVLRRGSVPGVGPVVVLNPVELHWLARILVTDCPQRACLKR